MTKPVFNFEDALKQLQSGKKLTGEDGVLTPLIKQPTEAALQAELDYYLQQNPDEVNRKNGYGRKTVKATSGSFELDPPRDRAGSFEPQLVKKHQTRLSEEIDNKIISLFSLGMSYKDIQQHIAEIYCRRYQKVLSAPLLIDWYLSSNNSNSAHWKRLILLSGWMPFIIKSEITGYTCLKARGPLLAVGINGSA